jgi:hypothetical protein
MPRRSLATLGSFDAAEPKSAARSVILREVKRESFTAGSLL